MQDIVKFPKTRGQVWLGNNMGTQHGSYAVRFNGVVRGSIYNAGGVWWVVYIDGERVGAKDYLTWAKELAREKLKQ